MKRLQWDIVMLHNLNHFDSLDPRKYEGDCEHIISNSLHRIIARALTVKLRSGECHRASLLRCWHWSKYWLCVFRQQGSTLGNVDPYLSLHVASFDQNGLMLLLQICHTETLTINQHWIRLSVFPAAGHYPNQWWCSPKKYIQITRALFT